LKNRDAKDAKGVGLCDFGVDNCGRLSYKELPGETEMSVMHTPMGFYYYYFSRRAGMP